jgi:hypothetical protein
MGFSIGPIKLPSPKDVVNAVKDAVGEVDLTKPLTGPLGLSKLGLEVLTKGAKETVHLASLAGDAASGLVGGSGDGDEVDLHAAGRGAYTASGSGVV